MLEPVTVVIPARNESATIADVVRAFSGQPPIAEVVVVDNASTDGTASVAARAGARVVSEPACGLGRAMKRGIAAATTARVLRTDGDISNWSPLWVNRLCGSHQQVFTRAVFTSPYDHFPVTRLVVRPLLRTFVPELADIRNPISGTFCFSTEALDWQCLPDGWACDVAILLEAHASGMEIHDVDIGVLADTPRAIDYYEPVAQDIHNYFIDRYVRRQDGKATAT